MADYKDVAVDKFDISGREFYQETITPNSEHPRLARIYYNSDGTIDEKNTYLEWYIKEVLHPEQPTKKSVKKTKKDDKDEARPNKRRRMMKTPTPLAQSKRFFALSAEYSFGPSRPFGGLSSRF